MTCRSSLRSGPGWLRGINGSITAHCASESQNRSVIAASMLQTAAVNHKTKAPAIAWFGSDPSVPFPKFLFMLELHVESAAAEAFDGFKNVVS
jgi:hypothetical protein